MKIAFDTRIYHYTKTGIARYLYGLVNAFSELQEGDDITLLAARNSSEPLLRKKHVRTHRLLTPPHFRFEQQSLFFDSLLLKEIDLIHCIDFYAPFPFRYPRVHTAQDLYFLKEPQSLDPASRRHYTKFQSEAKNAAHTVCISESTRRDLLNLTDVQQERTSVIYPGFTTLVADYSESFRRKTLKKICDGVSPILMVGTIEPRKNYLRALKAYEIVFDTYKEKTPPLVVVGKKGYRSELFFQALDKSPANTHVRYEGSLTDTELSVLYDKACVLLYPSLYEGFGFPILEAFGAETPVVTSNLSSMLEIGKDAVLTVDPEDEHGIAQALLRLLEDSELSAQLIKRGKEELSLYTWQQCACEMREVYKQVLARV